MFYSTSRRWFWEHGCICDRLRSCEQRVNDEWVRDYGGHRAFALGVQAAWEAVMRTCGHTKYEGCSPCLHDDALAAIDALREEKR